MVAASTAGQSMPMPNPTRLRNQDRHRAHGID
jgi:hypothetical protein